MRKWWWEWHLCRTDVCDTIYHQFFADLALIYFNPNEVMLVTAIFAEKGLKIFCDINLTQSGWWGSWICIRRLRIFGMYEVRISGMPVKIRCSADLTLIFFIAEIVKCVWDKYIFRYLLQRVSIKLHGKIG